MLSYTTLNFKSQLKSDYLGEDIYNLLDRTFVVPQSYVYNVFEVTRDYIARPDLISYDAYGDTMYADVICKLNGISNPFELNEGMKLILPAPDSIDDFTIRPNDTENILANGLVGGGNITKQKNSKRKANEAIVGDSRFKIDKGSKIIIY
jgi:hypothetical protein